MSLLAAALLVLAAAAPVPAAASVLPPAASPATGPAEVERHLGAMGTELEIRVAARDRAAALAASEAAAVALAEVEARLSTWRPDSELSRLNAAPAGRPAPLSAATLAELAAAAACWRDTGGAFDPAVGALVAAWGLREGGRVPSAVEIADGLAAGGLDGLELAPRRGEAVRRHDGLRLEEGGFGKGAGLAAAAAALAADPSVHRALVDLGGQLALVGEGPWNVEVADPHRRGHAVVALTLDGGSLATSGNSERGIEVDGRRFGHLLDPATGHPVEDFGSVTVWSPDPLRADCLSTALYVMGPRRALEWAAVTPDVEVLVVESAATGSGDAARPRITATPGLARRAVATAPGVVVETFAAGAPRSHSFSEKPNPMNDGRRLQRPGKAEPPPEKRASRSGARIHQEYR